MSAYPQFDLNTRPPTVPIPPGSWDCQVHVFGPPDRYPTVPAAVYAEPSATVDAMLAMHKVLGIDRGVLVQPTPYGTDHCALIDALSVAGKQYIGCARVDDSVTESDLRVMHEAGVRGARFNFHPKLRGSRLSNDEIRRTVDRVASFGWYFQLQMVDMDPEEVTTLFDDIDANIVIDHMGPLRYDRGVGDRRLTKILSLLDRGNWWLMLSNGTKRSVDAGFGWDDSIPFARAYIDHAPDRVLWASDWPHPLHPHPMPNDGELIDLLRQYAPDEATLHKILVDNPERIFGSRGAAATTQHSDR